MRLRAKTVEAIAPWIAGVVLAAPVVLTRYPPMGDLPMHEAIASLLRHYGDPHFSPRELYALNLGHPQQLFTLLVAALSFVFATDTAAKIAVAATIIGTLGAAGRLARHAGVTQWTALAMAPLVVGWTFYLGFASSMLGIALFLATLPELDRLAEEPTPRRSAIATLLVLLVFSAHAVTGACAVGALLVLALLRRLDFRQRALAIVPAAVGASVLVVERLREGDGGTPLLRASSSHVVWHGLGTKLSMLPTFLFASHARGTLALVAIVAATAIGLLARGRLRERRSPEGATLRERAVVHRFAIVAAVLAIGFLAAPFTVGHGTHLYVRFLVPTVAIAIVAIAPRPSHTRIATKAICAAAVVAPLLAILPETFRAADQHYAVARLATQIEKGSSIAIMHVGPKEPNALFDAVRVGHRALAERGGRMVFSFAEYPTSVVAVRPRARWDELTVRLYRDAGELRPASDLRRIRYVLVHVFDRDLSFVMAAAMAPEAKFVDLYGEWMLFESRLPVLPIDAPEELEGNVEKGATLQERARANADRGHRAAAPAP